MFRDGRQPVECRAIDATALLTTSTYFILLAFFVVLAAISDIEPAKGERVMESVTQIFGTGPTRTEGTSGTTEAMTGIAEAAERHREIGLLVETRVAMAVIEHLEPGRLMQVTIPAGALLSGDQVLPEAAGLLDKIARAVRMPSGPYRHHIEVLGAAVHDGGPTVQLPLEVRRVGSLARALMHAGAPTGSLSIGLEPGDPREIRFVFRTAEAGAGWVDFRDGAIE